MTIQRGAFLKYTGNTGGTPPKPIILFQRAHAPRLITTFLSAVQATAAVTDNATVSRTYKATSRHRYPGGPGISVKSMHRETVVGPPARRAVLPGFPVTLEIPADGTPYTATYSGKLIVTQITIAVPFTRFYKFCEQNCVKSFLLRSQDGKPEHIIKAT